MSTSLPILLVACNQRNLDLLSQFLTKAGYLTKCVKDFQSLEMILGGSVEYGLAMVDISGFNRDIWKYCEILSSQGVPLLMIAPQKGQQIQYESLAHGAKGVLYKPLAIKELLVAVSELFGEAMGKSVILIVVDQKGNRELLEKTLKKYYDVKVANDTDSLNEPFDLGIFDGSSVTRLRRQLREHREKGSTLFQPILLVSSRQDISIVTGQLWQSIDEIIFSPIERKELLARVEVLIRAHNYSVELAELYANAKTTATLEERQRLARELHDSVNQMLFSASALAQTLPQLQKKDPERARLQLEEVAQLNRSALSEIRTLLLEMRPGNLLRMSLKELFDQLILGVQGRRNIKITCTVDGVTHLPDEVHLGLYRIVQEALNNIVKHSEASEVHVELTAKDGQVVLQIRDNGGGFDTEKQNSGFGLETMRERSTLIGAVLTLSSQKGKGTEIIVSMPVPQALPIDS